MSKLPEDKRSAFAAAYRYYEEHWDMPDTDEAWTEAAHQMGMIALEHGNTTLIQELLMACYQTIDLDNDAVRKVLR